MSVQDKVAIVTGGGSGIGRASALRLAAKGATVVVADWNVESAADTARQITASGGRATEAGGDLGKSKDARRLVEHTLASFGKIDVLVHCAGICPRKPFLEMTEEDWHEVLRVNLDSSFFMTQAVAKVMVPVKRGTIILLTSDRGVHGSIDYAHYAASKGGQIALTKSLALSLGKHGITVNAINPGLTDTPLGRKANPNWDDKLAVDVLGKTSQPEEIAEIVLFLAGTAGAFMTGQIVSTRMRLGI